MTYEQSTFRLGRLLDDQRFTGGPFPGEEFPDFDVRTADGGRMTRADLLSRGPALVTTGSFTCPMTASATPVLKRLHEEFGHPITFAMLYVREAHPGSRYPQPASMAAKARHARDLRARDRISWPILVDDVEGSLHRRLDEKPNAAYIVGTDGIVLFRSLWASHEWTLREGLAVVAAGGRPMEQREPRLTPIAAGIGELHRVLELAGDDAGRDVLYGVPPLYVVGRVAHMLPFDGPVRRGIGALGVAAGLALGAALAALRRGRRGSGSATPGDRTSAAPPGAR